MKNIENDDNKCRLDKWLWAARFFKTRSLATDAIDSGKVHVNGERVKPAKEVRPGLMIQIRNKDMDIEVEVLNLSNQRRGAPEALCFIRKRQPAWQNSKISK